MTWGHVRPLDKLEVKQRLWVLICAGHTVPGSNHRCREDAVCPEFLVESLLPGGWLSLFLYTEKSFDFRPIGSQTFSEL